MEGEIGRGGEAGEEEQTGEREKKKRERGHESIKQMKAVDGRLDKRG